MMTGSGQLVLIVDDDHDLLDLVDDALSMWGYRTARASNGQEALLRVAAATPALILLDMRMPIMDGWTFARIFHERYGERAPIVVMTAAEDSQLLARTIGANADLAKPFELARLCKVVSDVIGAS